MKTRFAALAFAALSLWLIPSAAEAQGRSGKDRLTICHIPPGNPDARRTMEVPENAWPGHESHGDALGPCDGYAGDPKRGKKADKAKKRNRRVSGDEGGAAGDEIESDDEGEPKPAGEEADETDRRTQREPRREREKRVRPDVTSGDDANQEAGTSDAAAETPDAAGGVVDAGDSKSDAGDSDAAKRREARRARRVEREAQSKTPLEDTGEAEADGGFMGGVKRFFGFGEDKDEE